MSAPKFDQDFWENLWSKTLRDHADKVARRPPNPHLTSLAATLTPGRALDAGCGHGAEALWLAAHGWTVTAIDFSAAALAHGRAMAEAIGTDFASRMQWLERDVALWAPEPKHFDLVTCLYVHVADSVSDFISRLAHGVAPGGNLFLVGHQPIDPSTGLATAAASQVQISVDAAIAALDSKFWDILVAEERPRAVEGSGVDAVVHARRKQ